MLILLVCCKKLYKLNRISSCLFQRLNIDNMATTQNLQNIVDGCVAQLQSAHSFVELLVQNLGKV